MKKICCFFNYPPHYRYAIYNAMDRTLNCDFFFGDAPNPNFCVPSQFVSWSAQALQPPSKTYVSVLHDM